MLEHVSVWNFVKLYEKLWTPGWTKAYMNRDRADIGHADVQKSLKEFEK